jgi:sugar/nucleoside kinase (ribokinase family)
LASSDPLTTVIALFPVSDCRSGSMLLRELKARGVCVNHIVRYSGRMSRNLVIEFRGGGARVIGDPDPRADEEDDHDLRPISELSSLLLCGSVNRVVLRKVIETARIHRVPWSWNPAPDHLGLLTELASGSSLLQLDHCRAAELTGLATATPPPVTATVLQRITGARTVVLTCGEAGSVGRDARGRLSAGPPPKVNLQSLAGIEIHLFALLHRALHMSGKDLAKALPWASEHLSMPSDS